MGATNALEKKKQRGKASITSAPKRPKLLELIFASELLQSKGNSKDDVGVVDCEESPRQSPAAAAPIMAMAKESDKGEGQKDSPLTVESRPAQTIPEWQQAGAATGSNA